MIEIEKILKKPPYSTESTSTSNVIESNAEKPILDFSLKGNTYQQTYTGANLFDISDVSSYPSGVTVDSEGWITVVADNTNGSSTMYKNISVRKSNLLTVDTNYLIVCEVEYFNVTGTVDNQSYICPVNNANYTQFATAWTFNSSNYQNKMVQIRKTKTSFDNSSNILGGFVAARTGAKVETKFRISVLADTTVTADTFIYEPYVGGIPAPNPSYPQTIQNVSGTVNIKVENKNLASVFTNNLFVNNNSNKYLSGSNVYGVIAKIKPNTQYTIKKNQGNRFFIVTSTDYPAPNVTRVRIYEGSSGEATYTFTTNSSANYLFVYYSNQSSDVKIQIEEGSTATNYVAHQEQNVELTLPEGFELCKIDSYQDSIIKQNGKWYKNKVINKIASYDGETITTDYISTTGQLTTGATVYYVLETPELEEITDTTLKGQLNEILEMHTYIGNTYIEVDANLEMNFSVKYIEKYVKRFLRNIWNYLHLQNISK